MHTRAGSLALVVALLSAAGLAAGQAKPSSIPPLAGGEPVWRHTVPMPDGSTLVSDGAIAIDVAIAKPARMPTTAAAAAGKIFDGHYKAAFTDEVALGSLRAGLLKNTYAGPRDVAINGDYVTYLRKVAPRSRLRFRGPLDPIVIVDAGRPIGVVMAVASSQK